MTSLAKQSYKQSYTDNVELSIFNCGHEYCEPGHTWGPGVRDHYLIHLVVAGKGVYQVNGASFALEEGATNESASELLTKLGLFGPVLDGVQRAERSGKFTYMTRYCESNIMLLIVPAL